MNSVDYLGDRAEEILARTFAPTPIDVEVLDSDRVVVGGTQLPSKLTKKEAALLLAILRRGAVCTKEHLLTELYAGMDEPEMKIIDVFACKLRRKLGEHAGMVETVWGRGYQASRAYRLVEQSAALRIDRDLRGRLDELALAMGRRSDELGAELLLRAVRAAEKATWA